MLAHLIVGLSLLWFLCCYLLSFGATGVLPKKKQVPWESIPQGPLVARNLLAPFLIPPRPPVEALFLPHQPSVEDYHLLAQQVQAGEEGIQ